MKRAVLYFRVSKNEQNYENQVPDLRKYCKFRGWENAGEFKDEGVSGAKATRPELEKMMYGIRAGRYNVLLVWSYDRFARSLSHLVRTLDELHSLGVDFASFKEQLDTATPQGKLMFGIYGAMAEFERSMISARTRATLARLKAQGKVLGRPREIGQDQIVQTISLRSKGYSMRDIGQRLGISRQAVCNIIMARQENIPPVLKVIPSK